MSIANYGVWEADKDNGRDSYLIDIGTGGLFIKTNDPLNHGEKFGLKITLPDNEKELEVLCEVVWNRKEEEGVTPKGEYPLGMGVRFVPPPKRR